MSDFFTDGEEYSGVFFLPGGPMQIISLVKASGTGLTLQDIFLYPVTGSPLVLGVPVVLSLFNQVANDARAEGYTLLTLKGYRTKPGKLERILCVTRRLR